VAVAVARRTRDRRQSCSSPATPTCTLQVRTAQSAVPSLPRSDAAPILDDTVALPSSERDSTVAFRMGAFRDPQASGPASSQPTVSLNPVYLCTDSVFSGFDYSQDYGDGYLPPSAGMTLNDGNATFVSCIFANMTLELSHDAAGGGAAIATSAVNDPDSLNSLWVLDCDFAGRVTTDAALQTSNPSMAMPRRLLQSGAAAPGPVAAKLPSIVPVATDSDLQRPVFSDTNSTPVFVYRTQALQAPLRASALAAEEWQPLSEDDAWFVQTTEVWHPDPLDSSALALLKPGCFGFHEASFTAPSFTTPVEICVPTACASGWSDWLFSDYF
jgi:hypothetical protein